MADPEPATKRTGLSPANLVHATVICRPPVEVATAGPGARSMPMAILRGAALMLGEAGEDIGGQFLDERADLPRRAKKS